jgi:phage-related protein
MDIVYYYDKKEGNCPVKKYLESLELEILATIDAKISFLKEGNGSPAPPISFPLKGYNFFEIKNRKNKNTVIRVLYFCHTNRVVLLNAFEKPDNYSSSRVKKIIKKHYDLTEKCLNNFLLNPNYYEVYKAYK